MDYSGLQSDIQSVENVRYPDEDDVLDQFRNVTVRPSPGSNFSWANVGPTSVDVGPTFAQLKLLPGINSVLLHIIDSMLRY